MTPHQLQDLLDQPDLSTLHPDARTHPFAPPEVWLEHPAGPSHRPTDDAPPASADATWLLTGIFFAWSFVLALGLGAIVASSIAWSTGAAALVTLGVAVAASVGSRQVALTMCRVAATATADPVATPERPAPQPRRADPVAS